MPKRRSEFYKSIGHGDKLDFYKHIENGSLRIAIPPKGKAFIENAGQRIPVLPHPDLFSYVTPENDSDPDPAKNTSTWEEGTQHHYTLAEIHFPEDQKRKDFQDKLKQIKRSCPICKDLMDE